MPLPIGNGEQALNARSLVEAGAARLVVDTRNAMARAGVTGDHVVKA